MAERIKAWTVGASILALVGVVIWVFASASSYNAWSSTTCEDAGLTWVKEYPFGGYGCAEVIPFDEVEQLLPLS